MIFYPSNNSLSNNHNYLSSNTNQVQKKIRLPFKQEEDDLLRKLVEEYGDKDWALIASHINGRTVRQCRERWQNNLSSSVVKTKWTKDEDRLLKLKYQEFFPKWKLLEEFFPGRTSYNIRNRWNGLTRTKKKSQNISKINKSPSSHQGKSKSITKNKMLLNATDNNTYNYFNEKRSFSNQKLVYPIIYSNNSNEPENTNEELNKEKATNVNNQEESIQSIDNTSHDDFFSDLMMEPFFSYDRNFFFDNENLSCF